MTDLSSALPEPPRTGPGDATLPGGHRHPWHRFVALGDSFTEGIGDPDPHVPGGHRGWADLVAAELGRGVPDFAYANLAIRGRLYERILAEQLEPGLALEPDLVSLFAGGNDVLRRGDPDVIATAIDDAVGKIRATGADVIMWTGPDVGSTPVFSLIRGRVAIYNENMRAVAQRHGAFMVDLWALRELAHEAMWAEDRLHFSPIGHRRIAVEVLDSLHLEHGLEPAQVGEPHVRSARDARRENIQWMREHLGPWVVRRIRGISSGDGISPKRPEAAPVFGRAMPMGVSALEANLSSSQVAEAERQADRAAGQVGHAGEQAGSTPEQTGSTPEQTGSTPEQTGSTPEQTGSTPEQTGSTPEQTGSTPEQAGSTPEQDGRSGAGASLTDASGADGNGNAGGNGDGSSDRVR